MTAVNTAIANMVIANVHLSEEELNDPNRNQESLETVKIADKVYKLVKAVDVETETLADGTDVQNLYSVEIAGVKYNLKTDLSEYATKSELGSEVGKIEDKVNDIEEIVRRFFDTTTDNKLDEIKQILEDLKALDPNVLSIMNRISANETSISNLSDRVTNVDSALRSEINTQIGNLSNEVSGLKSSLEGQDAAILGKIEGLNNLVAKNSSGLETLSGTVSVLSDDLSEIGKSLETHIANLYGVKRIRHLVFKGKSGGSQSWVTADDGKWCGTGDIVEQVSITIVSAPENINEDDCTLDFVMNGEKIITADDIIFSEVGSTFEFSFNTTLATDLNSSAFIVNLPDGVEVSAIVTYVILEK